MALSRARAAAQTVQRNEIGAGANDAASDCRRVMNRGDLDTDRLLVFNLLFQCVDQLTQVFNGIDIVVRRGA